MNYIILNGKSSNTITGLLIQSISPITKPKIRTQIEEIDGRDGDIVTKLGYSAYDKEIKIGLFGNYDIDDVISYFDTSGIVIFSNEPDKYYKFEILEHIDFERLIRFKTAKVVMHVQPFKYSSLERKQVFEIDEETSIEVRNNGNCISKPKIRIEGTGIINLSLNDYQVFVIDLSNNNEIIIDTSLMEAYDETSLLNRLVTGNYDNFSFKIGLNEISWSGTGEITQIEVENYSRWI